MGLQRPTPALRLDRRECAWISGVVLAGGVLALLVTGHLAAAATMLVLGGVSFTALLIATRGER